MSVREVSLEDGKYTLQFNEQTGEFKALRYGEEWQNLAGDKLALALLHKIEEQQEELEQTKNKLDVAVGYIDECTDIMSNCHGDDNDTYHEATVFVYKHYKTR